MSIVDSEQFLKLKKKLCQFLSLSLFSCSIPMCVNGGYFPSICRQCFVCFCLLKANLPAVTPGEAVRSFGLIKTANSVGGLLTTNECRASQEMVKAMACAAQPRPNKPHMNANYQQEINGVNGTFRRASPGRHPNGMQVGVDRNQSTAESWKWKKTLRGKWKKRTIKIAWEVQTMLQRKNR